MTSPFLRTFYAALISWSLLFVYLLAFYQSANTPLRAADLTEVLQTAAPALAMSGAIAALIWLLGVLLGSIPHPDRLNTWLLRFAAGPVIFVLALMVVENWFYSLLGVGLKSGQNLWLKIKYEKYKWGVGSNWPSRKRSEGRRSWMKARAVPAVSTRTAGLVDLFRVPSKPGTNNCVPTNFSVASLLIECC